MRAMRGCERATRAHYCALACTMLTALRLLLPLRTLFFSLAISLMYTQKSLLLKQLFDDPDRLVRKSIGGLISSLGVITVPKNQWNELLPSLLQFCQHPNEAHREIAMMLFSALAENLTVSLRKHFGTLQEIFTRGLSDSSVRVRVESVKALATLVDMLDAADEGMIQSFKNVIDPLLKLMAAHFRNDDVLLAGFEVLENLAESPTAVLDPFIPQIAELMCAVVAAPQQEAGTREKAAYLLTDIIKYKVHRLLRPVNLIPALIEVAYKLITEPFDEEEAAETGMSPQTMGLEILDAILLNLHIPKKDVFPPMYAKAAQFISTNSSDTRKGGYVLLSVMSEGAHEYMCDRLSEMIPIALAGLQPSEVNNAQVRLAATIAIEQFAEHLSPDVDKYHSSVLPALLTVIAREGENDVVRERACGALDVFCQQLEEEVGAYIEAIMPPLMSLVPSSQPHISRSAMSAIKAVATAAKGKFEPYLQQCMVLVGAYLPRTDDEGLQQRCYATQCVGAMGLAVGKERFCRPINDQPGECAHMRMCCACALNAPVLLQR